MSDLQAKQEAIKLVASAATIHSNGLKDSLEEERRYSNKSFDAARSNYISKLNAALSEVARLKLDEELKVSQRVADLTLEESVDLLHAVEDHIRNLRAKSIRSRF